MQQWNDEAYILSLKPFGETSLLVSIITREHGKYVGLVRGGRMGKNRAIYQVGNLVNLRWQARLDEQLGMFIAEQKCATLYQYFDDEMRFAALTSMFELLDSCLNERELCAEIYAKTCEYIAQIVTDNFAQKYWDWEHYLLSQLGFATQNIAACSPDFPNLSGRLLTEQILTFKGKNLPILREKLKIKS